MTVGRHRLDLAGLIATLAALVVFVVAISGPSHAGIEGPAGAGGDLALIEEIVTGSDVTTVTFSALDGDTSGMFLLTWAVTNGTGSTTFYDLRPNGATSSQSVRLISAAGSGVAESTDTAIHATWNVPGDGESHGLCWIWARTGRARVFWAINPNRVDSSTMRTDHTAGQWAEEATNITSLEFVSNTASGIGEGSRFSLYGLRGGG